MRHMLELSLPEQVVVIAHKRSGKLCTEGLLARASAVAAAFAELRLAGRIDLNPATGTIRVRRSAPIGSPRADDVLHRLGGSPSAPPYQWMQQLSIVVFDTISEEFGLSSLLHSHSAPVTDPPDRRALIVDVRTRMRAALDADDMDSAVIGLGTALWGGCMLDEVLGVHAPAHHVRLAHHASRDWLGKAVRTVAGASTRLSQGPDSIFIGPRL
jgi:hypothetical protein